MKMKLTILSMTLVATAIIMIKCTKDNPLLKPKPTNAVFFRGVGINVNGEAQSYSKIVNYILNPKKKNQRRFNGGYCGNIEFWGNTPDGQIIVKMTSVQSCTTIISFTIYQENGSPDNSNYITRTETFAPFASDTFHVAMVESQFTTVTVNTNIICPDFVGDPDGFGPPNNFFSFNVEELPMHFKTFDAEGTKITFTITNLDGADHINIEGSVDGKTWKTLKVIPAKDIVLNQLYTVNVNTNGR